MCQFILQNPKSLVQLPENHPLMYLGKIPYYHRSVSHHCHCHISPHPHHLSHHFPYQKKNKIHHPAMPHIFFVHNIIVTKTTEIICIILHVVKFLHYHVSLSPYHLPYHLPYQKNHHVALSHIFYFNIIFAQIA